MLYTRSVYNEKVELTNIEESFSLAGYNLIYKAWLENNSPINIGWSIDRKKMSAIISENRDENKYSFVIDFDPNSSWRIGLVEIENIHIFTYGNEIEKEVYWSPIMLELKDLLYIDLNEEGCSKIIKEESIKKIKTNTNIQAQTMEFLYLNGGSWTWGKNGMTNAAFIKDDARKYFKQFF